MTDEQDKIIDRFRRLVKDAHRVGLKLIADSDDIAVRFVLANQADEEDIRELGESVSVDGACGSGSGSRYDVNGNG